MFYNTDISENMTYASISEIRKYLFLARLFLGSRSRLRVEAEATAPRRRARTHLRQRLEQQPISKLRSSPLHFAAARWRGRRALRKNSERHSAAVTRAGKTSRTQPIPRHSCTAALPLRAIIRSPTAEGDPPPSLSAVFDRPWQKGNNRKVIRETSARILESRPTENLSHLSSYTRANVELFFLFNSPRYSNSN